MKLIIRDIARLLYAYITPNTRARKESGVSGVLVYLGQ